MSAEDLHYLAGVIDTRSSIKLLRSYSPLKGYHSFILKIRLRCGEIFTKELHAQYGGHLYGKALQITTFKAERLLQSVLPYLKSKQQEAEIAIAFSKSRWIGNVQQRKIRRFELVRQMYFLQGGTDPEYLQDELGKIKRGEL